MPEENKLIVIGEQTDDWLKARIFECAEEIAKINVAVRELRAELGRRAQVKQQQDAATVAVEEPPAKG